jgi:hypothetical protein
MFRVNRQIQSVSAATSWPVLQGRSLVCTMVVSAIARAARRKEWKYSFSIIRTGNALSVAFWLAIEVCSV